MYKIEGENLKKVRERESLTQEELGKRIGKNKVDVGHYENNRATPPANALITFMIEFDVNPKNITIKA